MIIENYRTANQESVPKRESWLQHRLYQLPDGYDVAQEAILTSLRPYFVKALVTGDKNGGSLNKKLVGYEDCMLGELEERFSKEVVDRLGRDRPDDIPVFAELTGEDIIAQLWMNAFDQLASVERQIHDPWQFSAI